MKKNELKKIIISSVVGGLTVIIGLTAFCTSATKIKAGYTGIIYSINGGIKEGTLSQGLKFVAPFGIHKVNQYSTATEQAYLSRDKKEGSNGDDSFSIPTSDGKTVNVDLEFSYHFDVEKLPETFTRFKGQSGKVIENTFIRGKIKAWSAEASSKYSVIDIYGEKRAELNASVFAHVKAKFEEYGIIIDSVNFSRIELDTATAAAIQERINRQQELETEKINLEKAKIENQKRVEQAQAEADAKVKLAEAEAKANELLKNSLNGDLLKLEYYKALQTHGFPKVIGGDGMSVITDIRE